MPSNWFEAFDLLKDAVEGSNDSRKTIFIDELPWIDTPKSGFLSELEGFWNQWASARKDIVLVVCGSATSWIINKVLRNRGGLHNRVTAQIPLEPFTLGECERYAVSRGMVPSRAEIVVTTYGIKRNRHSGIIQSQVTMDQLFAN